MATDFHIYIHNVNGTDNSSGDGKNTSQTSLTNKIDKGTAKAINFLSNPDSAFSTIGNKVINALPFIATAYATINITRKCIDRYLTSYTMHTGDYASQINWSNFQTSLNNVLHPFSTAHNVAVENERRRLETLKRQEEASLLGDSIINSYYKGV